MLFSESWLRTLINSPLTSEQLAHQLTMAGLEVESREAVAPEFSGVVVAQVLTVERHPDAERLSLCTVDAGEETPLQIVCGAKNVTPGIKVPCAKVGAVLPENFVIKPAKLRGVDSFGMLCSGKELGVPDEVDGLLILPESFTVGQCIREALALNDQRFVLKITPNRADCLSMVGLAREIAALESRNWAAPQVPSITPTISDTPAPHIEDKLSPHFSVRWIRKIDNTRPTPLWIRQRLERAGMRSINIVVDITNYVMLEWGQPLHAYDAAALQGNICVRLAKANERLSLLNGQSVELTPDTLVVADAQKGLALAGVMGGETSSVTSTTTDILLESAFWHPHSVSGKARHYILSSEAAHRFERGVDPQGIRRALERATQLILEFAGGQAGPISEALDASSLPTAPSIPLRAQRIQRILGFDINPKEVEKHLSALGCTLAWRDDRWTVSAPSWRVDLEREVDLIEELARLVGYDHLPTQAPTPPLSFLPAPEHQISIGDLKTRWVENDYQEAITFSFVSDTTERLLNPDAVPLPLLNPIAQTMNVMRTTLWSGLLPALQNNVRRKIERVRLFELGRVFLSIEQQPIRLGGLAFGPREAEQWGHRRNAVDIFDVKADLEGIFRGRLLTTQFKKHPALHPGRSAAVYLDGVEVGILGELHPQLVKQWDLPNAPILFELEVNAALQQNALPTCMPLSDLPVVRRDLALVAPQALPAQQVLNAIKESGLKYLQDVTLFDVFEGGNLEPHLKSLAVRLHWQPQTQTLTDADIQTDVHHVLDTLNQKLNVVLRS